VCVGAITRLPESPAAYSSPTRLMFSVARGDLDHALSRFGDFGQSLAAAPEDDDAQLVFEQPDLLGHTGLRGKQDFRRLRDVEPATRDLDEITQLL